MKQGPEHLADYIRALNRQLADFIDYHRDHRVDGLPWHLVINGDMFDFVKVSVQPDPEDKLYERWIREGGGEDIVPNTPENVVFKLLRILEIHRPLFKQVVRFMMAGHKVTIIEGNHDAEVYFPEVRDAIRDFLLDLGEKQARSEGVTDFSRETLSQKFGFRKWFLAEPGRFHIEHGHQYDEYCSFEYHLAPLNRKEARTLATPFTHRLIPYFADLLGDFSTHGINEWGVKDYAKFGFSVGPKMLWVTFSLYLRVVFELVGQSGTRRRQELKALKEEHQRELEALAKASPYSLETLTELDRLKAPPAELSVWRMMHGFYLDRFIGMACMPPLLLLSLILPEPWAMYWTAVVLIAGGAVQWVLAESRAVDINEILQQSAARIQDITGARFVLFGHSHHAELVDLRECFGASEFGERAFYLNSGSWVTREVLRGEASDGMTYIEMTGEGAQLKQWVRQGQKPLLLATSAIRHPTGSYSRDLSITDKVTPA